MARFCQPSRNIFENKMTSFQRLLTPIMDHKLSIDMNWFDVGIASEKRDRMKVIQVYWPQYPSGHF